MKYSYNWLKKLSGTKLSSEKLAELIGLKAFEIEGVEKLGQNLEGVIVGKVLEVEKHPNADRLRLTLVDIGGKQLKIVCGAPNVAIGQKVAVATMGTVLPNGLEIRASEIRGVESQGMLCAEDELGLGGNHEGILLLPTTAKVGTPLAKALGLDDTILEIDILANRAHDALSHVGMAREIVALAGGKLEYAYDDLKLKKNTNSKLKSKIAQRELASRYMLAKLSGIKVAESPQWLKQMLAASGIKAINNVVDVTNFVMLELGQPLHAFDFKKVTGEIAVRGAKENEELALLDGSVKKLSPEDIVIADANKTVALAGVMGGANSAIDENTDTILLEAATFSASQIRRTRMRLGLATDAALRFEKHLDPNLAEKALVRAIELLENLAGAHLDDCKDIYPQVLKSWKIKLEVKKVAELLGEQIPVAAIKQILQRLDFKVTGTGKFLQVSVPTFRLDIETQEDLIEEIGRIYGYEKIKPLAPAVALASPEQNQGRALNRKIRNLLVAEGFSETYNYSFYSEKDAQNCGLQKIEHLELENPGNPEQKFLRISLIPHLLKNVANNLKNFSEVALFEIGNVYWSKKQNLPEEKPLLNVVLSGSDLSKKEKTSSREQVFFQLKQLGDGLLSGLGFTDWYYDTLDGQSLDTPQELWHVGRTAEIKLLGSGKTLGFLGEIDPKVLKAFDLEKRVAILELDLAVLRAELDVEFAFEPISKYPVVLRDIALLATATVRVDEILRAIQGAGGELILDTDLFDIFDFEDGSTSYAFRLKFGSSERTLASTEVDHLMQRISQCLEADLGLKLRK